VRDRFRKGNISKLRKLPMKRGAYQPSSTPWNDGGRSFSTREHPAVYRSEIKKLQFLRK
jgi:hypothetical protein